jgi:hypothetical protein
MSHGQRFTNSFIHTVQTVPHLCEDSLACGDNGASMKGFARGELPVFCHLPFFCHFYKLTGVFLLPVFAIFTNLSGVFLLPVF